ncbi:dTDP-4-dehydrorhamnose 3,5-epimerase [compost metagenome]
MSETAVFVYKCDQFYNKDAEAGIRYNDPILNIDWKIPASAMLLSEKDVDLPFLKH